MDSKELKREAERFAVTMKNYRKAMRKVWGDKNKKFLILKLAQSLARVDIIMDLLKKKHNFKVGGEEKDGLQV